MSQLISLFRICTLSLVLAIGYALNFVSVLEAFLHKELPAHITAITYISSSAWLFCLCSFMVIVTLFGVKLRLFGYLQHRLVVCLSFFIGASAYIACLLLPTLLYKDSLHSSESYIHWQIELLYVLLPIYLAVLIYYIYSYNDSSIYSRARFTQITNLILFSLILFVTPFIDLVLILVEINKHNENVLQTPDIWWKISAYFSICTATSLLAMTQIVCMFRHYNSGLFLKLCIIATLTYGITVLIAKEIDLDKYADTYRLYYYYALLIMLFAMYSVEIFIPGPKRVLQVGLPNSKTVKIDEFTELTYDLSLMGDQPSFPGILHLIGVMKEKVDEASVVKKKEMLKMKARDFNPNEKIDSVIKIFPDFKPCKENKDKYFAEFDIGMNDDVESQYSVRLNDNPKKEKLKAKRKVFTDYDRFKDSITVIVPFYNEKAAEIHATLRSLYLAFKFIKEKDDKYKYTHFNVLLVGDGWFKADISTKRYLTKLYNIRESDKHKFNELASFKDKGHTHNTVILQTKNNRKLCINPFRNSAKKLFLKVTTIVKIDNRKKANSHEWFLGKYGFAEWCKCDYMYFTDAYSTVTPESLYRMIQHMNAKKNSDVTCCTGRARVYTIEQELEFQNMLREETFSDESAMDNDMSVSEERKYDESELYEWWQSDIFKAENEEKVSLFEEKASDEKDHHSDGDNVFYKIQDTEFDHRLTTNAHLRDCQMFEFEALYGTIGCYLLGGFLPVIPGPCGFYRSKYLLTDEVRGWYFDKINQRNDPNDMDLVLGNMKLAEDRILTISSILNYDKSVRHSLIPECIFYFDPMQTLPQLMKQRRRWLNGSVATVVFILRKIAFSNWNVSWFRRYYVLSMWYMQLIMYFVVALSPPLIFIITFNYGLATILDVILVDHGDGEKIQTIEVTTFILLFIAWSMYVIFIYFMQRQSDLRIKWKCIDFTIKKASIVSAQLVMSFIFGLLILVGTLIQLINIFSIKTIIADEESIVLDFFNVIVLSIEVLFFVQSFILAPLVSKDLKTLSILLRTCVNYFVYSPFYVSFFFINALANIHDLSWGTRPDKAEEKQSNPKQTTIKVLCIVLFMNVLTAIIVNPLTEYVYSHIIFFAVLAFPSLYQIFFSLIWLVKTRLFDDLWSMCKPKKLKDIIDYTNDDNDSGAEQTDLFME